MSIFITVVFGIFAPKIVCVLHRNICLSQSGGISLRRVAVGRVVSTVWCHVVSRVKCQLASESVSGQSCSSGACKRVHECAQYVSSECPVAARFGPESRSMSKVNSSAADSITDNVNMPVLCNHLLPRPQWPHFVEVLFILSCHVSVVSCMACVNLWSTLSFKYTFSVSCVQVTYLYS